MFTYGYLREATMAHLDIDEEEAQAMNLLSRFHIFANEAMQAICASKPKYQYIDVTVVKEFAPLVIDGASFIPATEEQIHWDKEKQGEPSFEFANEEQTKQYYHERDIYKVGEKLQMSDTFIVFANKQAYKIVIKKPSVEEQFEIIAFGGKAREIPVKVDAKIDDDFSYISKNQIKFYKEGQYLIPAEYLWFRFDSGISDEQEIDMPADIFLTIPLYIASICLEIDNMQRAQIVRNEFETALARCKSADFITLNKVKSSW